MTMVQEHEAQVAAAEADIAAACGALNVAHAKMVQTTARVIEHDLWKGWGIKSVEHWLCWQAGVSPQRARQIVAVARRADELPVTISKLADGELSIDQVVTVAAHAPAHNDAEVASLAAVSTVGQLRSVLSRYSFHPAPTPIPSQAARSATESTADPATESATESAMAPAAGDRDPAAAPPTCAMFFDGSRFVLHLDAPADVGALVQQAMREAKDSLFHNLASNGADDADATSDRASGTRRQRLTWADAMVEICNRSLSGITSTGRIDKYRVYLHLDTDGGWVTNGPAVPGSLLSKLTCNGVVHPVWETAGAPINVGRAHRIVPDHTRRLIEDRDRVCLFPGCGARHHLEIHHLTHWSAGGRTDPANLGCLCPHHHDAHHRGDFTITGRPDTSDGLTFMDPTGRRIPPVGTPTPPPGLHPPDPPPGHRYRHPIGESIQTKWVYFTPRPDTRRPTPGPAPGPAPEPTQPPSAPDPTALGCVADAAARSG